MRKNLKYKVVGLIEKEPEKIQRPINEKVFLHTTKHQESLIRKMLCEIPTVQIDLENIIVARVTINDNNIVITCVTDDFLNIHIAVINDKVSLHFAFAGSPSRVIFQRQY